MNDKKDKCQLCGFEGPLQKHHLIPQRECRNKYKAIKEEDWNHIFICDMCHRTIHAYFTEKELKDRLSTLELLKADEKFAAYLKWRMKHLGFNSNSTKMSNGRKK